LLLSLAAAAWTFEWKEEEEEPSWVKKLDVFGIIMMASWRDTFRSRDRRSDRLVWVLDICFERGKSGFSRLLPEASPFAVVDSSESVSQQVSQSDFLHYHVNERSLKKEGRRKERTKDTPPPLSYAPRFRSVGIHNSPAAAVKVAAAGI
jgi:hypothetical protein